MRILRLHVLQDQRFEETCPQGSREEKDREEGGDATHTQEAENSTTDSTRLKKRATRKMFIVILTSKVKIIVITQ